MQRRSDSSTKKNVWLMVAMLLVVGAILVALSVFFPKNGVQVGTVLLRFASADDYIPELAADSLTEEPQISPEQLLAERMEQMKLDRTAEFVKFFETNPARISFPLVKRIISDTAYLPLTDSLRAILSDSALIITEYGDTLAALPELREVTEVNYSYFDPLFQALERAADKPVRIVHYGDSQIEEDRISSTLRQRLQKRFGGGGVGLLPYKNTFYNLTVSEQMRGSYTRYSLISYDRDAERSGSLFGPLLQASVPIGQTTLRIFPRRGTTLSSPHYFNRVTVFAGRAPLSVSLADTTFQTRGTVFDEVAVAMPDSSTSVELTISGAGDVYGISLSTDKGVTVDNVPLRGCSGSVFINVSKDQLASYFATTNTRLIILQFGGNSIPALTSEKSVEFYVERLVKNAKHLSALAPQAQLLFVGPSDMVQSSLQGMRTHPYLRKFDTLARERLTAEGIAYWSMFEAMGGEGSMQRWVAASPRLATADYIHFTRQGAKEVATMLDEALMTAYRFYRLRQLETEPFNLIMDIDTARLDSIAASRFEVMFE